MLKVGIATTFLPGADRIWKPTYRPVRFFVPEPTRLVPFWWETTLHVSYTCPEYEKVLKEILSGENKSVFGDPPDMKAMGAA